MISEVHAYCEMAGVDHDRRQSFLNMIQKIDHGVLESIENRSKLVLAKPPKEGV